METIQLFASVPLAGFRAPHAREYWETYPLPPPSTVYGFLLSVVGEPNRLKHRGAEIAIALLSEPPTSVLLRTLWRFKNKKNPAGTNDNKRPDYQEVLTNIELFFWVRKGVTEIDSMPLFERLKNGLDHPERLNRFGAVSLGESTFLVNEVRYSRDSDVNRGRMLVKDDQEGDLTLPVWPDHVGSKGTRWGCFRLEKSQKIPVIPGVENWIAIGPK